MMVDLTKYAHDLEEVVCSACGHNSYEVLSRREKYGLPLQAVICRNCGLIYINPRPLKEMYEQLNMADYRMAAVGHDGPDDEMFNRQRDHVSRVTIPFIQRYIKAHEIEKVLDVGCLYGGTMAGWLDFNEQSVVEGIEPVVNVAEYARRKVGAKVTTGIIENFKSGTKFDLVIFAQALNHTLDPRDNLTKLWNILNHNGYLFISLYDAVSALLNRPMEMMVEITHPYMFGRESIQYLLAKTGFDVVGYEDRLLDAKCLTERDIYQLTWPRIRVLAKKIDKKSEDVKKPDYQEIKGRINRNIEFYKKWEEEIKKWYRPNIWRRIIKAARFN